MKTDSRSAANQRRSESAKRYWENQRARLDEIIRAGNLLKTEANSDFDPEKDEGFEAAYQRNIRNFQ